MIYFNYFCGEKEANLIGGCILIHQPACINSDQLPANKKTSDYEKATSCSVDRSRHKC